jgi:hypothetical protein
MSISDEARVTVLLADYISVDAGGKLNVIGGGWTIAGVQPNGLSAPQYVAVLVDIPSTYVGHEFALVLELHDRTDGVLAEVVGLTNSPEALRISQLCRVEPPVAGAQMHIPVEMFSRTQVVVGFQGGIPLSAGHVYAWTAEIDGSRRSEAAAQFLVAGPRPGPVIGGPAGPATIPTLPPLA